MDLELNRNASTPVKDNVAPSTSTMETKPTMVETTTPPRIDFP